MKRVFLYAFLFCVYVYAFMRSVLWVAYDFVADSLRYWWIKLFK